MVTPDELIDLLKVVLVGVLGLYMILVLVESLFGVPVPFV